MARERKRKISIIGAGFVGSTTAFALMNSGVATEICICDINMDKAMGEVMDLVHGTSFVKPVNIYAGLGVAMENGFAEVKENAQFITKSNDEDGVAYAIEKFVLGE